MYSYFFQFADLLIQINTQIPFHTFYEMDHYRVSNEEQKPADAVYTLDFLPKDWTIAETNRVLKSGGKFIGCFYLKGESKMTDILVEKILAKKGWFTTPFDTKETLKATLETMYQIDQFHARSSMVYFSAIKK